MDVDRGDAATAVRVLGVDPGTRFVGFGILDMKSSRGSTLVDAGVVRLTSESMAPRLEKTFREMTALIEKFRPTVLAIEEVFHGKNFQSALKLGQARGVVILAAAMTGLEVHEYSTRLVKKSVTGNGNAEKDQVQSMMVRILALEQAPEPMDVTDALAVAFCHGQRIWRDSKLGAAGSRDKMGAFKNSGRGGKSFQDRLREAKQDYRQRASTSSVDQGFLNHLLKSGKAVEIPKAKKKKST